MNETFNKIQDIGEGLAKVGWAIKIIATDLCIVCPSKTVQKDTGSDEIVSLCSINHLSCGFYGGPYITQGKTEPLNDTDIPVGEGAKIGYCDLTLGRLLSAPFASLVRR